MAAKETSIVPRGGRLPSVVRAGKHGHAAARRDDRRRCGTPSSRDTAGRRARLAPQGDPLDVRRAPRAGRALRARAARARRRARRPRRDLVAEQRGVGRASSSRRRRWARSWSTSTRRTGDTSSSTRCASRAARVLILAPGFRDADYVRAARRRRRAGAARAGRARRAAGTSCSRAATRSPTTRCASARPSSTSTTRSTSSTRRARRASRRARRSRTTTSSTTASSSARRSATRRDDRVCVPVPFYHCFGMVLGNLATVTHGACIVCPARRSTPRATLEAVAAERCTSLYGVPTMFIAELERARLRRAST